MIEQTVIDVHDHALEILAPYGPNWGPGYANHGPMGVEALVTLGVRRDICIRCPSTANTPSGTQNARVP